VGQSGRCLVMVGDYVNRGSASADVLELLCELSEDLGPRLHLLRGNHDAALLEFLDRGGLAPFALLGGLRTMSSYGVATVDDPTAEFRRAFPARHRAVLDATAGCLELDGLLISHAGFDPASPDRRDDHAMVFGHFPQLFSPTRPRQDFVSVCGHYVQADMTPFVSDDFVCLDSGCGTIDGAPLSVLLWPERECRSFGALA